MSDEVYKKSSMPFFLSRFLRRVIIDVLRRIRFSGRELLPKQGPALLIANQVSPANGVLIESGMGRQVTFVITGDFDRKKISCWLTAPMIAVSVAQGEGASESDAVNKIRELLKKGSVVGVFARDGINKRPGPINLKKDFEKIIEGMDVPVIPVYVDNLGGRLFSEKNGRIALNRSRDSRFSPSVLFGQPLNSSSYMDLKQAIMKLGSLSFEQRRSSDDLLHLRFIETAKRKWSSFCLADSTGKELTFGKALIGSILFSGLVKRLTKNDTMIGIMLPTTVGGVLANIAAMIAGKVAVNLNFLAGKEAIDSAIKQCNISTILTSRKFLEKIEMKEIEGMVYLEDLMTQISPLKKVITAAGALLFPKFILQKIYRGGWKNPYDMAAVIFSSGTTGIPKGVMLSHHNILSNVESFAYAVGIVPSDKIMAALPLFHSFGFTCAMWFPIIDGIGAVYHPNPMDAKTMGDMIEKYKATITFSTSTFCGAYVRKIPAEQFTSLRYAIVGAEKLRNSIRTGFTEKFGLELLEGYGCTETAPAVSVNVLDNLRDPDYGTGNKRGTIGHPIPGVLAKALNPDTYELLPVNTEGLLAYYGPNRMMGYLAQPEKTAEAIRDEWYVSGDIGIIDDDGFIKITDRVSRFSKIAGEMVPHARIEEEVSSIVEGLPCAVTAIPDEQKGERLIILHTKQELTPSELWERLSKSALPNLWIPRRDNIYFIEEIPVLGTGKTDLRKVKDIAIDLVEKK